MEQLFSKIGIIGWNSWNSYLVKYLVVKNIEVEQMEQLFGENEIIGGTGGTVIPHFFAPFMANRWNSYLHSNRHSGNGWNSSTGGRPSSLISPFSALNFPLLKDLMGDDTLPPRELFHPFQSSVAESKKLFHLKKSNFPRQKGEKAMVHFVKLTCSECGEIFLLEAENPEAGDVAKETQFCRNANIMRHGETFEHHQHSANFKWEVVV